MLVKYKFYRNLFNQRYQSKAGNLSIKNLLQIHLFKINYNKSFDFFLKELRINKKQTRSWIVLDKPTPLYHVLLSSCFRRPQTFKCQIKREMATKILETVEKKNLRGKITVGPCSIDGHRRKWLWQRQNGPGNGYTREENDRRKKNEQYIFTCVCVYVSFCARNIASIHDCFTSTLT